MQRLMCDTRLFELRGSSRDLLFQDPSIGARPTTSNEASVLNVLYRTYQTECLTQTTRPPATPDLPASGQLSILNRCNVALRRFLTEEQALVTATLSWFLPPTEQQRA